MDFFFQSADESHIRREKARARELRATRWWQNQLGERKCYYCNNRFEKINLTMDHLIPIVRGGRTSKSNVVVCCKECNSKKKYLTPVELASLSMQSISKDKKD